MRCNLIRKDVERYIKDIYLSKLIRCYIMMTRGKLYNYYYRRIYNNFASLVLLYPLGQWKGMETNNIVAWTLANVSEE